MTASDRTFEVRLLLVLLAMVAIFTFWVIPASVIDPPGFGFADGLAPSFSVYLVATLAAFTLVGRLIRLLREDPQDDQDPAAPASATPGSQDQDPSSKTRITIIIAICMSFAFLFIPYLGFYISSFGFVVFLTGLMGERRPVVMILLPALLVCGIYAGFELGFTIFLPRGELILQLLEAIEN
jgi:hypothetical protein